MRFARQMGLVIAMAAGILPAQSPLVSTGTVEVNGQARPYIVRHLPLAAFPDLPQAVAQSLAARGCTIPQSFEARGPENVIHGSFERPGSADWAALCSAHGEVSLLVFFASAPQKPAVLATALETARVQAWSGQAELGFNWAIDSASPERVSEAQMGMGQRRMHTDHDAVADSMLERQVLYRYFDNGAWTEIPVAQ